MRGLRVLPSGRPGRGRLYVNLPDGQAVAWYDRETNRISVLRDEHREAVLAALRPYLHRGYTLGPPPSPRRRTCADSPSRRTRTWPRTARARPCSASWRTARPAPGPGTGCARRRWPSSGWGRAGRPGVTRLAGAARRGAPRGRGDRPPGDRPAGHPLRPHRPGPPPARCRRGPAARGGPRRTPPGPPLDPAGRRPREPGPDGAGDPGAGPGGGLPRRGGPTVRDIRVLQPATALPYLSEAPATLKPPDVEALFALARDRRTWTGRPAGPVPRGPGR